MTGTGEWLKQYLAEKSGQPCDRFHKMWRRTYFDTLPTLEPPSAAPQVCMRPLWPLVPTTSESGR